LSPQRANAGNSMKGLAVTTLTPGASFAPSGSDDPTELSTLLQRAGQRLLDARTSGEVLEAMRLADLALHYAKVTGAANQTHADWRRIILRAEIRLVDEIDLGQANHELLQSVDTLKRGPVAQTSTSINYADLGITSQGVSEWREISDAGEAAVEPVINNALDEGRVPTKTGIRSYVHGRFGSGQVDWWTPTRYLEAARDVLGAIDLDPASSAGAQANVRATQYLTKETNGLIQPWGARLYLNPPHRYPDIADFVAKLIPERRTGNVTATIMLTNNSTDTAWFHNAADVADGICFTRGRIKLVGADGERVRAPAAQSQSFFTSAMPPTASPRSASWFLRSASHSVAGRHDPDA